jgi:hypothetical protein
MCAALMLFVMYAPALKARRGARAVARTGGTYCYVLSAADGIILNNGQAVPLDGDPDARAIESARVFAIRPDREHSFCIPKRVLKEEEITAIRRLLHNCIPKTLSV